MAVAASASVAGPAAGAGVKPASCPVVVAARKRGRPLASIGDGVDVRASAIPGAGLGLFATRGFARGDFITWMDGEEISRAEAQARARAGRASHIRSLIFGFSALDGIREPVAGAGGVSFANHPPAGTKPNSVFVNREDHTGVAVRVYLRALVDVAPGEEILVSYGAAYWATDPGVDGGGGK